MWFSSLFPLSICSKSVMPSVLTEIRQHSLLVPSIPNHRWNHVIVNAFFYSECQGFVFKVPYSKKKKSFWLQRKRWISSTPHCSLSVFQQRTPLLLHNEMEESIWGFVGWSFPVLPWLSTFNWLALKCSLLKELILALYSVFFYWMCMRKSVWSLTLWFMLFYLLQ